MKRFLTLIIALCVALCAVSCNKNEGDKIILTITLEVNGGEAISPIEVKNGDRISLPTPKKEGYVFLQWCTDKDLLVVASDAFLSGLTSDVTLYASWIQNVPAPQFHNVTFIADNAVITKKSVLSGYSLRDVPNVPEKENYDGIWNVTDFSKITEDITVTAVYTRIFVDETFRYALLDDGTLGIKQALAPLKADNAQKVFTLPESFESYRVTAVLNGALENCIGLAELTIPKGYERIEKNAFAGSSSLTAITVLGTPFIEEGAFFGLLKIAFLKLDLNGKTLGHYFGRKQFLRTNKCMQNNVEYWISDTLTSVEIIGNSIPKEAFRECKHITSINITAQNFSSIGEGAFSFAEVLERVTLYPGNTLTVIETRAFYQCQKLNELNGFSKVSSIKDEGFYQCVSLRVFGNPTLSSIGKRAFLGCTAFSDLTTASNCVFGTDALLGTPYDGSVPEAEDVG